MLITGKGHPNVTSRHPTTIAFTRDKDITPRGDCFVAVACQWEATPEVLEKLRRAKKVTVTIECGGRKETIVGSGDPGLTLSENDLVIRKSGWVDNRTLMIGADKAAKDLDKEVVQCLKQPAPVKIRVVAKP
ncbi:MAG: DUF371 domain-containing protein [Candidatus Diapherotrites archaeon]|nr:DUF371 domain-containing protein [Candidatus Diapherotrites archaeon]